MIPAVAYPGQESESLNVQFLVDSMLAMVRTARPFVPREDVAGTVARFTSCQPARASFNLTPCGAIGRNGRQAFLDTEFLWYGPW